MKLRDYQVTGAKFLAENKSAMLSDEPGVGKTCQAIEAFNLIRGKKLLVLCPASLKINWERELRRWLKTERSIHIIHSSQPIDEADIYIVNYDIIIKPKIFNFLKKKRFAAVVCDECHMLKNLEAKRTKAVLGAKGLIHQGVYKWVLTGTPVLNRPIELFPLLLVLARHIIEPYSTYYKFATQYCAAYYGDFGFDVRGASNLEELSERLKRFMLRRLKEDVLGELPPREYQVIELETDKSLPTLRDAEDLGQIATFRREISDIKYKLCLNHIKMLMESTDKLIVFAHHKEFIKQLRKDLLMFNPVVLTGGMNPDKKQRAVDDFQMRKNVRIFIGQIQAAGVGITLTASSHVVFAELSWSPEELKQCVDRAHRYGQDKPVLAQFLVMKDSIELNMLNSIMDKVKVIRRIYDERRV